MKQAEIFSLKRILIDLNLELNRFTDRILLWYGFGPLSDIEYYVIILEDRRFLEHRGVDFKSIVREFVKAITFRKYGGASTIDMQFVRTVSERYEHTARRKFRECILARLIQFQCNKICILRSYLDIAYFGTGIWGVEDATFAVLGKAPSQVKGFEAAYIASMLVYPRPRNANSRWHDRVMRRAQYGLLEGSRLEKTFKKIGMR